jgi:hypothetical protein
MYSLSVAVGSTVWRLLFKTENACLKATALLSSELVKIEDDFGQKLIALPANIHGVLVEDMDQSKNAYIEMSLHQHKTSMEAQQKAQRMQGANGPAVLTPAMGGIPFRQ